MVAAAPSDCTPERAQLACASVRDFVDWCRSYVLQKLPCDFLCFGVEGCFSGTLMICSAATRSMSRIVSAPGAILRNPVTLRPGHDWSVCQADVPRKPAVSLVSS